ncbi:MAG TPA: OsmC family protein [Chitinophagales bacterium]|nr:OsmC family protein [Chitinophagales bacterium]HRK26771.1 OsmC family protein [Chitinophagales bacterium]
MQVKLNRIDHDFHFEAYGASEVAVHIDGAPNIGGHNAGARPMELMLMGLGGCSAIDVILILRKQKQEAQAISITVQAERAQNQTPAVFTKIHVHYVFTGMLHPDKVERAIHLSMEKYCSVTAMLNKTAQITHSFEILPPQ